MDFQFSPNSTNAGKEVKKFKRVFDAIYEKKITILALGFIFLNFFSEDDEKGNYFILS